MLAQKGRSHLLSRDREEEKIIKGIKKISDQKDRNLVVAENENEYLRSEIEKIEDELKKVKSEQKEDNKNREILS